MAVDYYFVGQSVAAAGGGFLSPMLGPNGTAAAPTYSFSANTNTGVYRSAANTLAFSTNGTLAGSIDASGNYLAVGVVGAAAGTAAAPAFYAGGATDGMFRVSAGIIGLTGSGVETLRSSATVLQIPAAALVTWNGRGSISQASDGRYVFSDSAANNTVGVGIGSSTADQGDGVSGLTLGTIGNANAVNLYKNGAGASLGIQTGTRADAAVNALSYSASLGNHLALLVTGTGGGASVGSTGQYTWTAGNSGNAAADTGLSRSAAAVVQATNGTSGVGGFTGSSFQLSGTGNGALATIQILTAQTTLSGSSTNLVQIPAGSMVLAVCARVTTTITNGTGTTWSLGTGALSTDWGTGLAYASGTTVDGTNYVTFTAPQMYPTATQIVAAPNLGTFTGGVVRIVVYYYNVTAPTS